MLFKLNVLIAMAALLMLHEADAKSQDNVADFIGKQKKKLSDKGIKCTLKKLSVRTLDNFRLTSEDDKAVVMCILESMSDKNLQSSGNLWTAMGTLYGKMGQKTPTTACFKQAAKLSGKITPFIQEWSFLGPFVIGKMELDGDPLESFGGIANVSRYRYKKNIKFYSELISGGEIQWSYVKQASADKAVQIRPSVNWNELVNSLGSVGITEWQGWVVGELAVNENGLNIQLQCLGVHTIYIDGAPITGDVYHRSQFWYGVTLNQGLHNVFIRLRTKVQAQFQCKFRIVKDSFEILDPSFRPDLFDGHLFGEYVAVPIANYHHSDFLKITKVSLKNLQSKNSNFENELHVDFLSASISIAPGQILPVALVFSTIKSKGMRLISECSTPESDWDVSFELKFTTSAGIDTLPMSLRCRHARQSFLFTFVDHDGSVQHAAAIQPLQVCESASGFCPTVLSLHGTTIPPQNQADSYKHMVDGEFVFGFDHAWTLAPTRHGAHNWEGPGLLTAMSALENLFQLTYRAGWIQSKASADHVVFAGHSMGGHGAWHAATHYPDRALALISLAGWIKKEEYGDSNLFFRHDIATSHVEPSVKAILESCIIENDVDQHVSNLQHVPVITRIGAQDRTVHPWFVRRMCRLLKEEGSKVSYSEVKDKEHWWWDTVDTNDGGAVNDKQLRDFTNRYLDEYVSQGGSCSGDSCEGSDQIKGRYGSGEGQGSFRLVCYNPALGEELSGVRVLQQITPYRRSEIKGDVVGEAVQLLTRNVLQFSIIMARKGVISFWDRSIIVDGTEFSQAVLAKQDDAGGMQHFCRDDGRWNLCQPVYNATHRGPQTHGPARRIAEAPLKIIIGLSCIAGLVFGHTNCPINQMYPPMLRLGTQGSEESQSYILQAAVYISNLFFLTSDAKVDIVRDTDVQAEKLESTNVIVIGSPIENLHTSVFLDSIPMQITGGSVSLKQCQFPGPRTGVLTLTPNGGFHLALVLIGLDLQGLKDVISLASPTIPPMTRSPFSNLVPDFVITGPEFGRKGPGGYLCTGFYGNRWEYRSDLSSCACVF